MTCSASVVTFEGMSPTQQRRVMQHTDLAVFAHGAAVTNMLFLRFGAAVLEVYPFGTFGGW